MAASVLKAQLEREGLHHVTVTSAGTGDWHVGDPADRRARAALEERGYATEHEARQFRGEWFDDYHLVIAMDRDNERELRRIAKTREHADTIRLMLEFHPDAESLDVPDPYYGSTADFDTVLTQLEGACSGLVAHLRASDQQASLLA